MVLFLKFIFFNSKATIMRCNFLLSEFEIFMGSFILIHILDYSYLAINECGLYIEKLSNIMFNEIVVPFVDDLKYKSSISIVF